MSSLAEAIKQKKQAWLNYRKVSRFEIADWNNKVRELYEQIKEWLKPFENDGLLRFEEESVPVDYFLEEEVVSDNTEVKECLTIKFFNGQTIEFEPVGFNVVGGYGRLDMQLGLRKIMIVLKERDGDWIFTERYGLEKTPTYDFNQDSFEQIVTEFVESF
ncbi:MAG: hypothetical protein ABFS56_14740 [Pseudomonadota bacterium]